MADEGASGPTVTPVSPARPRRSRGRQHWVPAIAVAVVVHVAAFLMLGVTSGPPEKVRAAPKGLHWLGERADDEIEIRDPKAIFLPTRWNAATQEAGATDSRGPGEIFPLEEKPALVAPGASPPGLVTKPEGTRTAGVAIRRFSRPYFSAFGQEDRVVQRLPARAAALEVRSETTGALVWRTELTPAQVVAAGADPSKWPLWAPFEMLVAVEPTGTLGPPLVATPAFGAEAVEAVESFFRSALRSLLRPDLVLPAGYYRIAVGP